MLCFADLLPLFHRLTTVMTIQFNNVRNFIPINIVSVTRSLRFPFACKRSSKVPTAGDDGIKIIFT